ncbi:hypothetical protein NDU88_000146 [Pleurodeles waltl]|uniref:DDE Tnp4 domain-containing protein n=1 Tax=Pleurodeles waltl TaxID=8319 RepID=A0AAV7UPY3_PLEWA|nr:hypothetical protein NDU88_000146 [Pleurodeles waltl]
MNVQMVCLAAQYISHVNAKYPGLVHDAFILRNSSIPNVMAQLQRHMVWLIGDPGYSGDSGYPNLSWLLTPVRNPRTRAEERYNEAHGRTRSIIEQTFGLLKARFWCQIMVAQCMLHNPALRRHVPFLREEEAGDGHVAAVDPVDSEDEEAEDEEEDNRTAVIRQYFQ